MIPSKTYLKTTNTLFGAPTTKSGVFTTGPSQHQFDQTAKSCMIQNLPGTHRKIDLTNKLDYVVVFQAIEMERLSIEIESLRVNLKDRQIQINNYYNYEVQIKELTEQCHEYEEKLNYYQNELEKMSLSCNQLYKKMSEQERAHQNEVQLLNRKYENAMDDFDNEKGELKGYIGELEEALGQLQNYERQNEQKNKLRQQELVRLNENLLKDQQELGALREDNSRLHHQLQQIKLSTKKEQEKLKQEMNKSKIQEDNLNKIANQNYQYGRIIENINRDNQRLNSDLNNAKNIIQQVNQQLDNSQQKAEEYRTKLENFNQNANQYKNALDNQRKNNQLIKQDFNHLQENYQHCKNQLHARDENILELIRSNESLNNELNKERDRCEQIAQYLTEMNEKIEQGLIDIRKCKQTLTAYDQQLEEKKLREQNLQSQISYLQPFIKMNSDLKEDINQLKEKINQKEEELSGKQSHITDLTIENKELYHTKENLENNLAIFQDSLRELQNTLDNERQQFQLEKDHLANQFNRILRENQEEKGQILAELNKLKEEGLIHESTKVDLQALRTCCQEQALKIQSLNNKIDQIPIVQLKKKNHEHMEVEKANEITREELSKSILMNEQLINQLGSNLQEIAKLNEEIWKLEEQLNQEKDKNDDFFKTSTSSDNLIVSVEYPPNQSNYTSPLFNKNQSKKNGEKTEITYRSNNLLDNFQRPSSKEKDRISPYQKLPALITEKNSLSYSYDYKPTDFKPMDYKSTDYKSIYNPINPTSSINPINPVNPSATNYSNISSNPPLSSNRSSEGLEASRGKGPLNIKKNLVGRLADMGRQGYCQSVQGEGSSIQSSVNLQSSASTRSYYPPSNISSRPPEGTFTRTSSHEKFQKFKRQFKKL